MMRHIIRLIFAVILLTTNMRIACAQTSPNQNAIAFIDTYKEQQLKKDEFETTSAYQARISSFPGKEFVLIVPAKSPSLGPKVFTYDADTQTMTARLIGHGAVPIIRVIDSKSDEAMRLGPTGMLRINFQKFELQKQLGPSKEYLAQNAMGAQTMVKQITATEWSVALANLQSQGEFQAHEQIFKIDAIRAKRIVEDAKWRLYVTSALIPGQKNLIINDGLYKKPTLHDPVEGAVTGYTMVAILRRAELIDPDTNETLTFFSTGADYPSSPQSGARVLLGVTCIEITKELYEAAKMENEKGCMIGAVTPNSAAWRATLQPGDVILAFDDRKIISHTDLVDAVKTFSPGQAVTVTVWRDGREAKFQANF